MTLADLLDQDIPPAPMYETGVEALDKMLDGGLEMGQLITITGEQEAGKTMLVNQILGNVAHGHKCLYYSLEFNKRQLRKAFLRRLKNGSISKEAAQNIEIVTAEMTEGALYEVLGRIEVAIKNGVRFIAIDSAMMLHVPELRGEEEITEIFRKLQHITTMNDVVILLIAQSSKEDNRDKRISIIGSQRANHFANIMVHLHFDREKGTRTLELAKNKQTGKLGKAELHFDPTTLIFRPYEVIVEEEEDSKPKPTEEPKKKSLWEVI